MGLFSHAKKEAKPNAPPAPPVPPAPAAGSKEITAPAPEAQNLSAPPMPGGNLEDIKTQVSASPEINTQPEEMQASNTAPIPSAEPTPEEPQNPVDDDSLFDFSELDLEAPTMSHDDEPLNATENKQESHEENETRDFIQNKIKSNKVSSNETYFVTTRQFKQLLEIVESVKNKVKNASETHLKLLDIKAEEDIEYENLRKDFQFVEDKLHEVDSLIFDN